MATAVNCNYNGKLITVNEAMNIKSSNEGMRALAFKCTECDNPVRPHRSGGKVSAHFEHLKRNPECSLSHSHAESNERESIGASDDWSTQELRAAVVAYVDMQRKNRDGQPFVKKRYYAELHKQFGRTEKSYEFRMQNISYVLAMMGRVWLTGLKPAKNVGARVAAELEKLINEIEERQAPPVVSFEVLARDVLKQKKLIEPSGNQKPKSTVAAITQYQRDSSVKAWVLKQANGVCECCGSAAPFSGADGLPYLEVHHVQQLADGGPDTTSNAVALCPNCHREIHYGINSKQLVQRLYVDINRLINSVRVFIPKSEENFGSPEHVG
jgi:5-methylcytosine-specific restriction protein A